MESNIRLLREKTGLTQSALGEAIGLSQQVISRMENNRDTIQADILIKLADYFHVSTDYVLAYQNRDEYMESILFSIMSQMVARDGGDPSASPSKEHVDKMDSRYKFLIYQVMMVLLNYQL